MGSRYSRLFYCLNWISSQINCNSDYQDKLAALDSATDIADMDLPGWRLHPLKGKDKGRHAIWVSGSWRMTFEFENGDAYVVDYEDYH